jgi:uncharacterized protein (TIGR03382 family)
MWIKGAIMPIKAILFDHDGTLVDSESTHLAMWRKAIEPYNANITDDEYWTRLLGVPAEENARILIEMCDLQADIPTLVEAKMQHTTQHLTHTPFPKIAGADYILSTLWDEVTEAFIGEYEAVSQMPFSFLDLGLDDVFQFQVTGIETDEELDPTDSTAFITGLVFGHTDGVEEFNVTQAPIIQTIGESNAASEVPVPATLALFGLGLVIMARRRKAA